MKVNRNNPYGYKVCYREITEKKFITHFKTYTFQQAMHSLKSYIRYPPRAREDNHVLNKPYWVVIPIKKSEVRAGIWLEDPF